MSKEKESKERWPIEYPQNRCMFNNHGDTLYYTNGILVGIHRKSGVYIDKTKPSIEFVDHPTYDFYGPQLKWEVNNEL